MLLFMLLLLGMVIKKSSAARFLSLEYLDHVRQEVNGSYRDAFILEPCLEIKVKMLDILSINI